MSRAKGTRRVRKGLRNRPRPLAALVKAFDAVKAVDAIRKDELDPTTLDPELERPLCVALMRHELHFPKARIARLLACSEDTVRRDLQRLYVSCAREAQLADASDEAAGESRYQLEAAFEVAAAKKDAHGMVQAARAIIDLKERMGLIRPGTVPLELQGAAAASILRLAEAGARALEQGPPDDGDIPDSVPAHLRTPPPD